MCQSKLSILYTDTNQHACIQSLIFSVASSGAVCANSIMSVWEQLALNSKIKMPGSDYGKGPFV